MDPTIDKPPGTTPPARRRGAATGKQPRATSLPRRPGPPGIDRREIGNRAEDIAAAFLAAQGLRLLLRNYRRRLGELDVVALERDVLVVAEVRTRSNNSYGGAAASIDGRKRHRIIRATQQLLQQHRDLARHPVRFDVLIVSDPGAARPRVEWIRHAFQS